MGTIVFFLFYGSVAFCVVACAVRVRTYLSAPLQLRGELYRGSSIYELTDSPDRATHRSGNKVAATILDLLFLRGFYRASRVLWLFLFLFHAGLYLLLIWHLWLFGTAAILPFEYAWGGALATGHMATALTLVGAVGVVVKRIVDPKLRTYYPRIQYLKWLLVLLILAGGLAAVVFHFDSSVPQLLRYVRLQVTFQDMQLKLQPAVAPASHIFFVSFLLLYLPFSHVLQIALRAYQQLRWDEVPQLKGGAAERIVQAQLTRPINWAAPHIQPAKTWENVIGETEEPQ